MATVNINIQGNASSLQGALKTAQTAVKGLDSEFRKLDSAAKLAVRSLAVLPTQSKHLQAQVKVWEDQLNRIHSRMASTAGKMASASGPGLAKLQKSFGELGNKAQELTTRIAHGKVTIQGYDDEIRKAAGTLPLLANAMGVNRQQAQELQNQINDIIVALANLRPAAAQAQDAFGILATASGVLRIALQGIHIVINLVRTAFGVLGGVLRGVWGVISGVAGQIVGAFKMIAGAIGNIIQIVIGINLASLFRDIANSIRQLGVDAFNSAADLQVLGIRLQGLVAREIANNFNAANTRIEYTTATVQGSAEAALAASDANDNMALSIARVSQQSITLNTLAGQYAAIQDKNSSQAITLAARMDVLSASMKVAQNRIRDMGSEYDELVAEAGPDTIIVSKEIRGATMTVADAFGQAKARTRELLDQLKDLALVSPFTFKTIANTFTLASAYGFASDEAFNLTNSITEFAAGMGLGDLQIERIITNFGQMTSAGKVMGTELRDLARGGFLPVSRLLKDAGEILGVTIETSQDLAAKGTAGVQAFIQAFTNMVDTDFAGASARMLGTWQTLTSNIQDFIDTVLGAALIGPSLDALSGVLNTVFADLLQPSFREGVEAIGKEIGATFFGLKEFKGDEIAAGVQALLDLFGIDVPTLDLADIRTKIVLLRGDLFTFIDELPGKITAFKVEFDRIKGVATEAIQPVIDAITNLGFALGLDDLGAKVQTFIDGLGPLSEEDFIEAGTAVSGGVDKITEAIYSIRRAIGVAVESDMAAKIIEIGNGIGDFVAELVTPDVPIASEAVAQMGRDFAIFGGGLTDPALLQTLDNISGIVTNITTLIASDRGQTTLNFWTGLAGGLMLIQNLGIENMIVALTGLFNAITALLNLDFAGVGDAISGSARVINDNVVKVLGLFGMGGIEAGPGIGSPGGMYGGAPAGGGINKLAESVKTGLKQVEVAFSEGMPAIREAVDPYEETIVAPYQRAFDRVVGHSIIPDMMIAMAQIMSGKMMEIEGMLGTRIGEWLAKFTNLKGDFTAAGASLIEGLISGMEAHLEANLYRIQAMANQVYEASTGSYNLGSPSRLYMQVGEQLNEGLAIGLENSRHKVEDAMTKGMPTSDLQTLASASLPTPVASSTPIHIGSLYITAPNQATLEGLLTDLRIGGN